MPPALQFSPGEYAQQHFEIRRLAGRVTPRRGLRRDSCRHQSRLVLLGVPPPTTVGHASPVRARACLDLHQGRHAVGRRTPNTSAQDALHGGVRDCDPTGTVLALAASRQVQLGTGGNALDVKLTQPLAVATATSENAPQGAFGTAWNGLVNCTFRLVRNMRHRTVSTAYAAQARAPNPVHVVRGGVRESNSIGRLCSE